MISRRRGFANRQKTMKRPRCALKKSLHVAHFVSGAQRRSAIPRARRHNAPRPATLAPRHLRTSRRIFRPSLRERATYRVVLARAHARLVLRPSSRVSETMPATVSRSVRSTHASAKAADVLETSAAAARRRLSPTRESLVSKKKRRPRVSALVRRLEALLLSGASRASPPDPDGIRRATRRSRHRRPRRIPPSQATSDDAPKRRAPDAERRELTASKTPKSRRPGAARDTASNSNSRSTSTSRSLSQPRPLATRPSERSTRAPRCPPAPSNTTRKIMRAYAAATRSRARRRRFARPIASLASHRLLVGTRLPDPDAVARLLEGHIDTYGTCITARTFPFPEHAPALTPATATEASIEPATASSSPFTPPFSPAPSSAGERLLRSPAPSSVVGDGALDTFGSNLPVSARLRGEHLERDGDTLAARLPGDVFAATGRIARRDSVASLASTWIPEEEDDEGTNATRSKPSPCEWEDAIEDDGKRRFTASFLTSPVAWTPASPAPRRRRRRA